MNLFTSKDRVESRVKAGWFVKAKCSIQGDGDITVATEKVVSIICDDD